MSGNAGSARSDKVSAISPATPTASGSSAGAYIPVSLVPTSPRSTEVVGDSGGRSTWNEVGSGSGLAISIKNLKRKKNARERLHPLEGGSPRFPRHHQQQRHLSIASSSPSRYGAIPHSPRAPKGAVSPEDSDDEVIQLKRLNAHLASGETVEEWIRSYEVERGNFASFAVFTEVKLDEVQEGYVEQVGRPNAVEAAACCATLLKMPGIVGCYRTLLEKMSAGIQGAIYLPDASLPSIVTDSTSPDAMSALVQSFYTRTPYFDRVSELEKTLLASRSITDPNVLRAVSVDDVARIFQYVPFAHVQAGIAKVYATNSSMLDQLVNALQEQQGLLLLSRRKAMGIDDPDYPVHVPLATSAQICRAITHNAASFSSSGRDMILCAIVELVDADSFRDVFEHFDLHGKMCFLHSLSCTEGMDQLELVVDALPNAGESLFRLYLATCSGQVGDLPDDKALGGEMISRPSPKDVFFLKLLGPDMEFFFLSDLAAYLTEARWHLLSKEYEKNDNERKARKLRRASMNASDFDIEIEEDTNDGRPMSQSSAAASIDRFRMIMLNYLRHHNLSSAQLLQLVSNTFLLMLGEKECGQLMDKCWTRFPLDEQWSKALVMVQDLGNGGSVASSLSPPATPQDVNHEYIAAIRLKMLKTLFKMLSREERAAWIDRINVKYPTDSYKKKIQNLKDAATAAKNTPPDLSDPATHISRMKADLKVRWLEAIMEYVLNETESSARLAALKQALQPFANGKMPPPPVQQAKTTLASAEKTIQQLLGQLSAADRAALLSKLAPPPGDKAPSDVVDRAASPVQELEQSTLQGPGSSEVQKALKALLDQKPEDEVLEILQDALDLPDATALGNAGDGKPEAVQGANLSRRLKRRLTAVNAVSEPMEWQQYVKVGCLDVGCQTTFEVEQEVGDLSGGAVNGTSSARKSSRPSASPIKAAPLTLTALLGKSSGGKSKKDRYQKINSAAVPRAISGLITSWRMNTDQLIQFAKKSLANVLKIIADAYSEMLTATRRKNQQQRVPYATSRGSGRTLSLSQIVYQSFLHSYGLPGIADMHLLAFSCAIEAYRVQHLRVEQFAQFCFEEAPKSELTNYLQFLECIVSDDLTGTMMASHLPGPVTTPSSANGSGVLMNNAGNSRGMSQNTTAPVASKRSRFGARLSVPDKETWMISVDRAQEIAQLCFRDMRKATVSTFCENLATIAAQGNSTAVLSSPAAAAAAAPAVAEPTSGEQVLNVDHLLQLVVAEWRMEQVRRERHLLDAFRAGDVNGDGQLTSAEFTQIVLSIDASRDLGDILLMYSDTLRRTQCDQLNAEVFLQVAREHELDRVVWQGDGDLYGVVNEVTDMEATWAHVRGFFVGTLEALARDLPPTHFLRACEGAGCGCLKCLLDGYVGFQKMRHEFQQQQKLSGNPGRRNSYVGVSSQLVWARFWHLMRQLHDAAAESDGVATPWEGIQYDRDQPVLALAPRSNTRRRDSLPNFLFPDTARITAKMSAGHHPEAFDAPTIHAQFAYLLSHVTVKGPEATTGPSECQQGGQLQSVVIS